VDQPLTGDSKPVILGQVVKRKGEFDPKDPLFGMRPDDGPAVEGKKNNPMMPIGWTKTYQIPGGETGRVFTTTMGSSTDLLADGTRRMIVNAAYWCLGMEDMIPTEGAKVDIVGDFKPTAYGFFRGDHFIKKGLKPADFK